MNLGFSTPISMTFTGKFWAKISPEPVYQSSFLTKLWAKTDVSAKKNFKLRSKFNTNRRNKMQRVYSSPMEDDSGYVNYLHGVHCTD